MRNLCLKPHQDTRLKQGHLWIFSNEVDTGKTPLTDFEIGEDVNVADAKGQILGSATINPNSLITARIHAKRPNTPLDCDLLRQRLECALNFRQSLFAKPFYRLLHAEGDFLPGLILDRYGDYVTLELNTQALEKRKELLLEIIQDVLKPKGIALINAVPVRSLENLSLENQFLGDLPDYLELPENGATFTVPLKSGQKTGWFYDQRENRLLAANLAKGRRVLDACCYLGGFGVLGALHGAKEVTLLDASAKALELAAQNVEHNAKGSLKETLQGDVFEIFGQLVARKTTFDLISIDPPALIKRRKDVAIGLAAYRKLNSLAIKLLAKDGILVSSSCSYHLTAESLRQAILRGAHKAQKSVQLLAYGRQGYDHPELLGMPETSYLKCYIAKIS